MNDLEPTKEGIHDGVVKLDKWSSQDVIQHFIETISIDSPQCLINGNVPDTLEALLGITDRKLIFTHNGTTYQWGTTDKLRGDKDQLIEIPAKGVIMGGELETLLRNIATFDRFIAKNKDSVPWLKYMDPKLMWYLASSEDYSDPIGYYLRRMQEAQRWNDLSVSTVVDNIEVRSRLEKLSIKTISSTKPYEEGPVTYHILLSTDSNFSETDGLHRVIVGVGDGGLATIYAIQADSLMGVGRQVLKNTLAEDRRASLAKITKNITSEFAVRYPEINTTIDLDVENPKERQVLHKIWNDFRDWYISNFGDDNDINVSQLINPALTLIQLEEIQTAYQARDIKLKRLNHGTSGGGSRMISLVATLISLKQREVKEVRIPLELPRAIHVYDSDERQSGKEKRKNTIANIKAGLIQTVQCLSRTYAVEISGSESFYRINLDSWDPSAVLTSDSKTIKSLVANFPIQ